MKLIGSTTSPFVRRIRLQLKDQDYEFICVNIFSEEGQREVRKYTTTGRIPILVDGETVIWDSLLIANYLSKEPFELETQKQLVLVNEMTDAGIALFQLRKFEIDGEDKGVFSQNHLKRIKSVLDYFEVYGLKDWNVVSQWIYCTLDWFEFRNVFPWREEHPKLIAFYEKNHSRLEVKSSNPR